MPPPRHTSPAPVLRSAPKKAAVPEGAQPASQAVERAHAHDDDACSHDHGPRRLPRFSDAAIERAASLFRAAGEPARLRMLELLLQGELCVTELATALDDQLSTVSQRLRVLRAEGLIARRRKGKHIYYALADQHVIDVILGVLDHATHPPHSHWDPRASGAPAPSRAAPPVLPTASSPKKGTPR